MSFTGVITSQIIEVHDVFQSKKTCRVFLTDRFVVSLTWKVLGRDLNFPPQNLGGVEILEVNGQLLLADWITGWWFQPI